MDNYINPFPVTGYHGADNFCNREKEIKRLTDNALNGIHTTLVSVRRMGKTGLLYHLFNKLESKRNIHCIYLDIYATQNQKELVNLLSTAVVQAFPQKKTIGKKIMEFIRSLRPVISFDQFSGQPEISFDFATLKQYEQSLSGILNFLEKQGVIIIIAIDEFQQISTYPEKNTEAMLRTLIQPLKNIRIIFSGSSKHVLTNIFNSPKRPFFGTTQMISLEPINQEDYEVFIIKKFSQYKRKISREAVTFISSFTRLHTYYTQAVCNRLFTEGYKNITEVNVLAVCGKLLKEQESTFFQYRNLLTSAQWQLLKAIACEDKLYQPNAKAFLKKYDIGTPSNITRGIEALLSKEMIYQEEDEKGSYYRVYDCFLARWLENM